MKKPHDEIPQFQDPYWIEEVIAQRLLEEKAVPGKRFMMPIPTAPIEKTLKVIAIDLDVFTGKRKGAAFRVHVADKTYRLNDVAILGDCCFRTGTTKGKMGRHGRMWMETWGAVTGIDLKGKRVIL